MMPIVDASVGLSQHGYTLSDYMSGPSQYHVLRMVAVQQRQSTKTCLKELDYLQTQATTLGSGGFPNAIVASVDLFKPQFLTELVERDTIHNLRGVCHGFEGQYNTAAQSKWMQSLDVLFEKKTVLDLTSIEPNESLVIAMAEYQTGLNIIIDLSSSMDSEEGQSATDRLNRLAPLAAYENVFLKICGAGSIVTTDTGWDDLVKNALNLFGHERIMFASGVSQQHKAVSFDQLWSNYVAACSNLSAKYRDSLFRSNAVRVYGL